MPSVTEQSTEGSLRDSLRAKWERGGGQTGARPRAGHRGGPSTPRRAEGKCYRAQWETQGVQMDLISTLQTEGQYFSLS